MITVLTQPYLQVHEIVKHFVTKHFITSFFLFFFFIATLLVNYN